MRINFFFCCLTLVLGLPAAVLSQTANFDETWKEFLANDKISNMSELAVPDKVYDKPDYAKYLLMNTNTDFCQSDVAEAEKLMDQIDAIDANILTSIPGFIAKKESLEAKIDAYHSMDFLWKRFLQTKEISIAEMEAIAAAKTSCEKSTLAKYSFMTAHQHFCEGDVAKAKDIFENRTLRLTEKTTLRVSDVEGLGPEVARLKTLFQDMEKLDAAWKTYVSTGVSPGFDKELPLFPCNPIPNMKVLVLKGVLDLCHTGPEMLAQIKQLQANSNVAPDKELAAQIKGFEAAIAGKNEDLAALNEAWEAFLPDNKVKHMGRYGYDYCAKEPLIRAYIMDGFAYTCELGTEMLRLIDSLQSAEITPLETITMVKIKELADLTEEYRANGAKIERLWQQFVSQGDKLSKSYQSEDFYCDNIHQVKDWTMQGLSAGCEQSHLYLEQIENFQNTFEFNFTEDLECRVQNLRVKVWDCRYQALQKLASLEAESDAYEQRIQEIMDEYKMGERPEECDF